MQATQQNLVDPLEEKYNSVPYQSLPFSQSSPTHLFTIATLFGLKPKPVENARILELGCASGGNLIPLAIRFPHAEFLGIDLAEKQVNDGLELIQNLKISNIRLRHQSINDFNESEGKFDYIIVHGVFSWVTEAIRTKILDICQMNLSEKGIAYISYNTLPGWNMVNTVRDMMSWHTQNIQDPISKAQNARGLLKFITDGLKDNSSAYAAFLKDEITLLADRPDSYLLHDHLSSQNQPMYFYQFMEKAIGHKLSYLADAFLPTMHAGNLPEQFATELNNIKNIIVVGQYMDYIRNQRFRATLLCHENNMINRALKTDDVEKFYLTLLAKPTNPAFGESDIGDGKEIEFYYDNLKITLRNAISQTAMLILYQQNSKAIHYNTLCSLIAAKMKISDLELIRNNLNNELNVLRAVFAGLITISSYPSQYTTEISEKPVTCVLARQQAKTQNHVTNRRHEILNVDLIGKFLLTQMDGTHDRKSLVKKIRQQIDNGNLNLFDENKVLIKDPKVLDKVIPEYCNHAFEVFAKYALLLENEVH